MYPMNKASAYDHAITVFSPEGKLYQVDYAAKMVEKGALSIGLIYDKGVLLIGDKRLTSPLVKGDSVEKIYKIDNHVAAISSGMTGDARKLTQMARQEAQENIMYYDEPIEIEPLAKKIASIYQAFTQYGGARPFGVSFIIAGVDDSGYRLFETDVSGGLLEYFACAIGKNRDEAVKLLEKNYKDGLSFNDAVALGLKCLKLGLDQKEVLTAERIEVAFINDNKKFTKLSISEIDGALKKLK